VRDGKTPKTRTSVGVSVKMRGDHVVRHWGELLDTRDGNDALQAALLPLGEKGVVDLARAKL
jgi:hypothetical protein